MLIWEHHEYVRHGSLSGLSIESQYGRFITSPGSAPCVAVDGYRFVMCREHTGGWTLSYKDFEFIAQDTGPDTVRFAVYTKELVASANVRNLVTDPALEADIKAAAQAQFKLTNEKNLLEVTKVQAERKREEAKGEADAIKIKAAAVAAQGGKEYVELKAIEKWDGKLPVTQAGGAVPFVNLK